LYYDDYFNMEIKMSTGQDIHVSVPYTPRESEHEYCTFLVQLKIQLLITYLMEDVVCSKLNTCSYIYIVNICNASDFYFQIIVFSTEQEMYTLDDFDCPVYDL
jgi:hypothetical protein